MKTNHKTLALISLVLLGLTVSTNAKVNEYQNVKVNKSETLPFVGKKWFNFYGGNGTGMSIEIKSGGETIIEGTGMYGSSELYKGRYKDTMESGEGTSVFIKGSKIYYLENGKQMYGCKEEGKICESDML